MIAILERHLVRPHQREWIGRLLDEGQLQIGCRLLGKDAPDARVVP